MEFERVKISRARNSWLGTRCSAKKAGLRRLGQKNMAAQVGHRPSATSGQKKMRALMR